MSTPTELKIARAQYEGGYILRLWFSDGRVHSIDFGPFLHGFLHPEIRKYLNPRNFRRFSLKEGDLMWGDFDLVFPIMDLYNNTIDRKKKAAPRSYGLSRWSMRGKAAASRK